MSVTYTKPSGGVFNIMLLDMYTQAPNTTGPHWFWQGNDVDDALEDIFLYFHKRYNFCAFDVDGTLHVIHT